jgi:hypothetical protein
VKDWPWGCVGARVNRIQTAESTNPLPPNLQIVFFWINAARRLTAAYAAAPGRAQHVSSPARHHGQDSWSGLAQHLSIARHS